MEGFQQGAGGERGHEHHRAGLEAARSDRAHCPGVWRCGSEDGAGDRQLYEGAHQGISGEVRRNERRADRGRAL